MDALVIGPPRELTAAVTRALRRSGRSVLQAIPADADGRERARWLLDEADRPSLIVVLDDARPRCRGQRCDDEGGSCFRLRSSAGGDHGV